MGIDETLAKIKEYENIVDQHVPQKRVKTDCEGGQDYYSAIRGACIEALAILKGDEKIFKICLAETIKNNPGMGWGFYFDEYNTITAAGYIRTLARVMKDESYSGGKK